MTVDLGQKKQPQSTCGKKKQKNKTGVKECASERMREGVQGGTGRELVKGN